MIDDSFKISGRPYQEWLKDHAGSTDAFHQQIILQIERWSSDAEVMHLKTSGSTGEPKSIALKKDWMMHSARATAKRLDLAQGQSALLCLPVQFIGGLMMLVRAMVLGMDIYPIQPSMDPELPAQGKFDFAAMTPPQVTSLLDRGNVLERIHCLIIGGAPVSALLESRIREAKTSIYSTYGMTETASHIALRALNGDERARYFRGLPGVEFSTDDQHALAIRIPFMDDTVIQTRDVVELLDAQRFIWRGRIDHVINSGGLKVHPEEIESALAQYIPHPFIIHSIPDPVLGEKVVLTIESEQVGPLSPELRSVIQGLGAKRPREVFSIKRFPRTASGKILRLIDISGIQPIDLDL
ncbi:MAG: AMP-binding protein [Flavobacteriales bacterium]|nr:AMP-binding protein [Flavobacteriales bacterium]